MGRILSRSHVCFYVYDSASKDCVGKCLRLVGDWTEVKVVQILLGEGGEVYTAPRRGEEEAEEVSQQPRDRVGALTATPTKVETSSIW